MLFIMMVMYLLVYSPSNQMDDSFI